jgi:mono/diheme cytochrome c family protein
MDRDHCYPTGRTDNQLRVLEHLGMLKVDRDPKATADSPRRLVDPYDPTQDLNLRARSWLHANCASCHVEAGGGNAQFDAEFATQWAKTKLDAKPIHQTFDLPDARLVAPGHPERSVLVHRVGLRGPGQMPPLSSSRVDEKGLGLMREWVKSLGK